MTAVVELLYWPVLFTFVGVVVATAVGPQPSGRDLLWWQFVLPAVLAGIAAVEQRWVSAVMWAMLLGPRAWLLGLSYEAELHRRG